MFHYIAATKPEIKGGNLYFGNFAEMKLSADQEYKLYVEDVKLADPNLSKTWGECVYRVCVEFNEIDAVKLNVNIK